MMNFEDELEELLKRTENIETPINTTPPNMSMDEYNNPSEIWMNDVQIFYNNYLKDVFISHANRDKEELVEDLYKSLNKLGIQIFYDKESIEWGDNWKDKILNGVKKAEFAIIVISENFFGREWTEKELKELLSRQNRNGQKLILPIFKNITLEQLQQKYPSVADIQAIDSKKYSTDEIALMFAK